MVTCRRSGSVPSGRWRRVRSWPLTGRTRGSGISRSCGSAGESSSDRPGGDIDRWPTRSSSRSTQAWPSGPASTRRPGSVSSASNGWPMRDAWREPASSTSAAARASWRSPRRASVRRGSSAWTSTPSPSRRRPPTPGATMSLGASGPARDRCPPRAGRSTSSWPTSSPGLLVRMAALLYAATKPGGRLLASGIYVDREPEVRRALAAAGYHVTAPGRRRATGSRWRPNGSTEHGQRRLRPPSHGGPRHGHVSEYDFGPVSGLFPSSSAATSSWLSGSSCPACCCRSHFAAADAGTGPGRTTRGLLWLQAHGTLVFGFGLAVTGILLVLAIGPTVLQSALAGRRPGHLCHQPASSPSSSSVRTYAACSARPRPTTRPRRNAGATGLADSATSVTSWRWPSASSPSS